MRSPRSRGLSVLRLALGLFAPVLLAPPGVWADVSADDFTLLELGFPEPARSHRVADVDGDGKLDLTFVFTRSAPAGKTDGSEDYWLRSCLQEPQPYFSRCIDLDLPSEARGYDLGSLDGTRGAELLLVTRDGGAIASFVNGAYGPLEPVELDSLLSATDDAAPLALQLLFDLDGDGRAEVLLPSLRGPALYRATEHGLSAPVTLESPATVRYRFSGASRDFGSAVGRQLVRQVSAQATALPILVDDFDGDGRSDIATSDGPRLRVFLQAHDGSFAPQPTLDIERSVLTSEEAEGGFAGETLGFADLDGDGVADLIALKWGSSDERTQMDRHLFFGRPGPTYPEKADQILRSESFFPDFEMRDLNGDGRRDLVIPYFHLAPSQAFKVLTQNALRIQLRLFLMRENGRYAQGEGKRFARVDRRVVLDYQLNVIRMIFGSRGPPDSFSPLLTTRGDFDGDGFADLASDSGADRLHLRFGNARAEYSSWPDLALPFESSLAYELVDLNGDGRSDLVGYYGAAAKSTASSRAPGELRRGSRPEPAQIPDRAAGPPAESRIRVLLSR
jgi:hypothetical protein